MARPTGYICRDFGRPLCCSIPDPRYTMRFDGIGEPPIFWCTYCGQQAQKMEEAIKAAIESDPDFADKFKKAIDKTIEEKEGVP